jgi:hypothetical protein
MATYRNRPAYAAGGIGARVAVARVITAAASVVAAIIVAAIVLHLLNANPSNGIVDAIHQAGSWLTTPFHNLFSPKDGDLKMALNWGIAAAVYMIVARFIARMIVR